MTSRITSGVFLEQVDWSDPRFAVWDLTQLGKLNAKQRDALMDTDYVMNKNTEIFGSNGLLIC